jgi:hypothetical protein
VPLSHGNKRSAAPAAGATAARVATPLCPDATCSLLLLVFAAAVVATARSSTAHRRTGPRGMGEEDLLW